MKKFEYTVRTAKSVDDAVGSVERATAAKGFRVLHTYDVAATLAEKGFQHDPLKIIEICNAKYANEVLQKEITTALMLPCPMRSVWSQARSHRVPRLLPLPPAQTKALARTRPVAGCRCAPACTMGAVLPAGRWAPAHPSRRHSSYAWSGNPNSSSWCPQASSQNTCAW
jgi:uncharacterized protein (DUF302 family)